MPPSPESGRLAAPRVSHRAATRHHASRRAQAGRAALPLLGLIAVLAIVAAVLWVLGDTTRDASPDAATVRASGDAGPDMSLPEAGAGDQEQLVSDDAPVESTLVPLEELLARIDYARREVPGRVVLSDGGPLPEGLTVMAAQFRPRPRVSVLSMASVGASMNQAPDNWSFEDEDHMVARATTTTVGPDGRFVMPDFPAEGAFVVVKSEWLFQADPTRYDGDVEELLVVLDRGARVEGRVLAADGTPAAGVRVRVSSSFDPYSFFDGDTKMVELDQVDTDDDGRFVLAPVPPGVVTRLVADDRTGPHRSTSVPLPALVPGETHELELTLALGASIAGRVLDEDDAPVEDIKVRLMPAAIDMTRMAELEQLGNPLDQTDAEGRFRFDGLPDGEFLVALSTSRYRIARSETLTLEAGTSLADVLLRAERGLAVTGRVVDTEGAPIASAEVRGSLPPSFTNLRANTERELRQAVEVDAEGRFELRGHDEGEVRVSASAPDFVASHVDVEAGTTDLELRLVRKTSISGIAISLADGEPLTDYTVRVSPSGGLLDMSKILEMEERMRSRVAPKRVHDDEGRFEVGGVGPGEYDLVVSADGYAAATLAGVVVEPGQASTGHIFMVPEEARVTGQVVSAKSGRPLESATVTTGKTDMLGVWTSALDGGADTVTTDAEGRFQLGGLGSRPVKLSVSHPSHQSLTLEKIALTPGQQHDVGVVALAGGAAVWGQVSDEHGQAEAGVSVMAAEATGKSMKRGTTDRLGMYRVEGLAPGSYNVMRMDFKMSLQSGNPASFLEELVMKPVALAADEEKRVDLSKQEQDGTRLEGRVTSAAGPETGAMLWIVRETGEPGTRFGSTDDDGHYAFSGVQPGRYLVQVLPSSETMSSGSQPTTGVAESVVIGPGPVQRLDLRVPGGVLRGEVVAADGGQRLAGVRVVLERTDDGRPQSLFLEAMGGRVGESFTADDGAFTFGHLPSGTYAVVAGGQNIVGLGTGGWAAKRVGDLRVSDGAAGLPVEVELDPGGGVAGTVRDAAGELLAGVPVWARDDETGHWLGTLAEVSTDGAGAYAINSLGDGPWTLAFGGDRHALTLVSGITVSSGRVVERDVRLERGVEVWIDCGPFDPLALVPWVVGPQGRLPTHLVSVERLLGGREEGSRLRLGRVPAGTYDLSVRDQGGEVHREQVVISGRDPSHTIVLEGDG